MAIADNLLWRDLIEVVPDFPKKGVQFRDLNKIYMKPRALRDLVLEMANRLYPLLFKQPKPSYLVAAEARGFIAGSCLAQQLGLGFIPARKPGKLPREVSRFEYQLEYGSDALEIHADDIREGAGCIIFDDVLATGGTASACASLIDRVEAIPLHFVFIYEIASLGGSERLMADWPGVAQLSMLRST